MGGGNCLCPSRNLSARAAAAFFARPRDQSRLGRVSTLVAHRLLAGELVFSAGLARDLPERLWNFVAGDVKSATLDHADLFVQFRRRLELALRGLRSTARIARSAAATAALHRRHGSFGCDLYFVLACKNVAALLAQRTQLRAVSESQSNRKPFWSERDHDSGLRSGRSSQGTKTLDPLGSGSRPDDCRDHFEFFTRRNRHPRRRKRALAWNLLAPPTLALTDRARCFVLAPVAHRSAPFWRANVRTISSSQSR